MKSDGNIQEVFFVLYRITQILSIKRNLLIARTILFNEIQINFTIKKYKIILFMR